MFWSDLTSFSRHNITINITSRIYKMKMIKTSLHNTLNDNIHKKAIVYCNTASSVDKIRDEIDNWLNEANTKIEGDTILINGDLESEWKFFFNTKIYGRSCQSTRVYSQKYILSKNPCCNFWLYWCWSGFIIGILCYKRWLSFLSTRFNPRDGQMRTISTD